MDASCVVLVTLIICFRHNKYFSEKVPDYNIVCITRFIFSHPICFLSKVTKLLMKLIKQAHQDKRCLCASANQTSLRVRLIVALSRELINPFIKNIFFYDNII
ncbi:hypothetical protein PHYBLDRAFT_69653 [Phycomyces blakesleeanus NRRL 1555(-)]|uniref:Uncharacterized protein n=1 Tax=Phycomyces blakesleeanus (strain ATCC 8743b / DSM 1359 / FGSC 10004 / NBRC 33097 / NRRL 1555) TaxID=763407 RepID=A0A162Y5H2_PHYB8|nr:hypothetical protein PHYBLDRAFT_69653 [Phycomyces blakesleeanus NRRL 1555(-)]OAD78405.1 hypothetical protein PHYBLDRAFT_69653 [Phycomyces blakesleeanus NRRL 1555(-)]|eukprot:XP_018296445.1 hypothetical protein PHYBLDRAFT_69653 [Phycomyces blakesleeanus NRRL 1555(-)]